jgi:hypothetical protein
MIFDKLAGYAERHRPDLVPSIQKTALFEFPYRAHETVSSGMFTQEDLEGFFLPFSEVAIEDRATCTVLFDTVQSQTGLTAAPRKFIDVLSLVAKDPQAFRTRAKGLEDLLPAFQGEDLHQITFGRLFSMELPSNQTQSYRVVGQVDRMIIVSGRGEIIIDLTAEEMDGAPGAQESFQGTIGNVITAIEELMLVNRDPLLFVFEQAPVKAREAKKGRILRSHDRPRYIMLKPEAIRRILGVKTPAASQPEGRRPHERRRHWRVLKSEKFTQKRGERILIEAQWVGPSEAIQGRTRYKVRLDL